MLQVLLWPRLRAQRSGHSPSASRAPPWSHTARGSHSSCSRWPTLVPAPWPASRSLLYFTKNKRVGSCTKLALTSIWTASLQMSVLFSFSHWPTIIPSLHPAHWLVSFKEKLLITLSWSSSCQLCRRAQEKRVRGEHPTSHQRSCCSTALPPCWPAMPKVNTRSRWRILTRLFLSSQLQLTQRVQKGLPRRSASMASTPTASSSLRLASQSRDNRPWNCFF